MSLKMKILISFPIVKTVLAAVDEEYKLETD